MSKQATKTNNDPATFDTKVALRLMSLPTKNEINVLDCFSGEGKIWDSVKKKTDKKINILSIDIKEYSKVSLKGDNCKFLKSIDLKKFDIIDLDAYGSPSNQLAILKEKQYKGVVHCTFIQTMMGKINTNILKECGYTDVMIKKIPTLFNKDGLNKILNYVYLKFNVTKFKICTYKNKNYFYFTIDSY